MNQVENGGTVPELVQVPGLCVFSPSFGTAGRSWPFSTVWMPPGGIEEESAVGLLRFGRGMKKPSRDCSSPIRPKNTKTPSGAFLL